MKKRGDGIKMHSQQFFRVDFFQSGWQKLMFNIVEILL